VDMGYEAFVSFKCTDARVLSYEASSVYCDSRQTKKSEHKLRLMAIAKMNLLANAIVAAGRDQ